MVNEKTNKQNVGSSETGELGRVGKVNQYWAIRAQLPYEGDEVDPAGYISVCVGKLLLFRTSRSAQAWALDNLTPDWVWLVEPVYFITGIETVYVRD